MLLKNGLIVDGTDRKGFPGDLLIKGPRIEEVFEKPVEMDCTTIDCSGKVIAPGFIDAHSHMDGGTLAYQGHEDLKAPFIAQGCTTFVAGNCGSAGSLRRNNRYVGQISLFDEFPQSVTWDSMEEYFTHLERIGLSHNLANLAGHATE